MEFSLGGPHAAVKKEGRSQTRARTTVQYSTVHTHYVLLYVYCTVEQAIQRATERIKEKEEAQKCPWDQLSLLSLSLSFSSVTFILFFPAEKKLHETESE